MWLIHNGADFSLRKKLPAVPDGELAPVTTTLADAERKLSMNSDLADPGHDDRAEVITVDRSKILS